MTNLLIRLGAAIIIISGSLFVWYNVYKVTIQGTKHKYPLSVKRAIGGYLLVMFIILDLFVFIKIF